MLKGSSVGLSRGMRPGSSSNLPRLCGQRVRSLANEPLEWQHVFIWKVNRIFQSEEITRGYPTWTQHGTEKWELLLYCHSIKVYNISHLWTIYHLYPPEEILLLCLGDFVTATECHGKAKLSHFSGTGNNRKSPQWDTVKKPDRHFNHCLLYSKIFFGGDFDIL